MTTIEFSTVYNAECFQLMKTFESQQPLIVRTTIPGNNHDCTKRLFDEYCRLHEAEKRLDASHNGMNKPFEPCLALHGGVWI